MRLGVEEGCPESFVDDSLGIFMRDETSPTADEFPIDEHHDERDNQGTQRRSAHIGLPPVSGRGVASAVASSIRPTAMRTRPRVCDQPGSMSAMSDGMLAVPVAIRRWDKARLDALMVPIERLRYRVRPQCAE